MKSSIESKVRLSMFAMMRKLERTNEARVFLKPGLSATIFKLDQVFHGRIHKSVAEYTGHLLDNGVFYTATNHIEIDTGPVSATEYHHGGFAIAEGWLAVSSSGELLFRPRRRHTVRYGVYKDQWQPVTPEKEEWLMSLLSPQQRKHLFEVQRELLCV